MGKGDARTTVGSRQDRERPKARNASPRPSANAGDDGGRRNEFPRKLAPHWSVRAIASWALRGCASAACRHSRRAVANFTISKKIKSEIQEQWYLYMRSRRSVSRVPPPSPHGAAAPPAVATGGPARRSRPAEWRACQGNQRPRIPAPIPHLRGGGLGRNWPSLWVTGCFTQCLVTTGVLGNRG